MSLEDGIGGIGGAVFVLLLPLSCPNSCIPGFACAAGGTAGAAGGGLFICCPLPLPNPRVWSGIFGVSEIAVPLPCLDILVDWLFACFPEGVVTITGCCDVTACGRDKLMRELGATMAPWCPWQRPDKSLPPSNAESNSTSKNLS